MAERQKDNATKMQVQFYHKYSYTFGASIWWYLVCRTNVPHICCVFMSGHILCTQSQRDIEEKRERPGKSGWRKNAFRQRKSLIYTRYALSADLYVFIIMRRWIIPHSTRMAVALSFHATYFTNSLCWCWCRACATILYLVIMFIIISLLYWLWASQLWLSEPIVVSK